VLPLSPLLLTTGTTLPLPLLQPCHCHCYNRATATQTTATATHPLPLPPNHCHPQTPKNPQNLRTPEQSRSERTRSVSTLTSRISSLESATASATATATRNDHLARELERLRADNTRLVAEIRRWRDKRISQVVQTPWGESVRVWQWQLGSNVYQPATHVKHTCNV
jgi:hypothetical protein